MTLTAFHGEPSFVDAAEQLFDARAVRSLPPSPLSLFPRCPAKPMPVAAVALCDATVKDGQLAQVLARKPCPNVPCGFHSKVATPPGGLIRSVFCSLCLACCFACLLACLGACLGACVLACLLARSLDCWASYREKNKTEINVSPFSHATIDLKGVQSSKPWP